MTPTERQREYRRKYYAAKAAKRRRKPRDPLANAQPVTYRPAPQAEEEPDAEVA